MTPKPLTGASALLVVSTGAERLSGLVVAALVARVLGPQAFGEYNLILALWNIFGAAAYFGQAQLLSREVIRHPERAAALLGTSAGLALLASAVAGGLSVTASLILGYSEVVVAGVGVAAVSILWADSQCSVVEALLIALHRVAPIALVNTLASVARVIASLALVGIGVSVIGMLWIIGITQIASAIFLWIVARQTLHHQRLGWDGGLARGMLKSAFVFAGAGVANIVFKRIDTLLLEGMLGAVALGIYSAAYRLVLIVQSVTPPLLRLLLPRFAAAHTVSARAVSGSVQSATETLVLVFGLLTIGLATVSPIVLTAIFGAAYGASIPAFLLLSVSTTPLVINGVWMTAANAMNQESRTARANIVSGVASATISVVFISAFGGNGAAAGVIVASLVSLAQAAWILRSQDALDASGAARIAAVALAWPTIASVATWLAYSTDSPVWVFGMIGLVCATGLLWPTRSSARALAGNIAARIRR